MDSVLDRSNSTEVAPWVLIQQKTFTNWVNEQLKIVGKRVEDLGSDFHDGLLLIDLMDVLVSSHGSPLSRSKRMSYCKNPRIDVQKMENVSYALNVMDRLGIKMVNIGNEDIVRGNLKLILALVWLIILKFQISGGPQNAENPNQKRGPPPKKLMLRWLNSVLPDEAGKVKNFSSDWNDGILLCALINYCDPSLMTDWNTRSRSDKLVNCREALMVANMRFGIPMVLSAEDLCSDHMDELSGMTYISYFVQHEAPGWFATLNWVRKLVPEEDVKNFQDDWNDGVVACGLINAVSGLVPNWKEMNREEQEANCQIGT